MRSVSVLVWALLAVQSGFGICQINTTTLTCLTGPATSFNRTCGYGVICYGVTVSGYMASRTENCPASMYTCETSTTYPFYGLEITCTETGLPAPSSQTATNLGTTSTTRTYTGGDILTGSCATPEFTLLPGPQSTILYYAGFVGCINNKPDCCPFRVSTSASTTTEVVVATTTGTTKLTSSFWTAISPATSTPSPETNTGSIAAPSSVIVSTLITLVVTSTQIATETPSYTRTPQQFPVAVSKAQSTLSICPKDYHMVSSSCCPL
jgi:hypothetical protein